jgi:hypothetical protein
VGRTPLGAVAVLGRFGVGWLWKAGVVPLKAAGLSAGLVLDKAGAELAKTDRCVAWFGRCRVTARLCQKSFRIVICRPF